MGSWIRSSLNLGKSLGRVLSSSSNICRRRSYSSFSSSLFARSPRFLAPQTHFFISSNSSPFISTRFSSSSSSQSNTKGLEETQKNHQITHNGNVYIKIAAAGGLEGKAWDDGIQTEVYNIFVSYTPECVTSLQFSYGPFRDLKLSPKHGGDGSSFQLVEIIDSICTVRGTYDMIEGKDRITSVQFVERNGTSHGPYGCDDGTPFCLHAPNGVIGFHGYADSEHLNAIGIYVDTGTKEESAYETTESRSRQRTPCRRLRKYRSVTDSDSDDYY